MWGTALVLAGVTVLVGVDVFWPSSPDLLARGPILVVGDSLVEQANQDLQTWNVPGAPVVVEDGPGSAPCDWAAGYVDPYTGRELLFSELLSAVHPSAVVFAFTGNPGLSGHPGCVDATTHYTLASLLDSYESTLIPMAVYAGEHGARGLVLRQSTPKPRHATRLVHGKRRRPRLRLQRGWRPQSALPVDGGFEPGAEAALDLQHRGGSGGLKPGPGVEGDPGVCSVGSPRLS